MIDQKNKPFIVYDFYTIKQTAQVIQENLSRCVVVLSQDEKVVGVFSEGDILRAILNEVDLKTPLRSIMKPTFKYLSEHSLLQAYDLIKNYGISLVPVVTETFELSSVITMFDIVDHLVFQEVEEG